ncbi:MAG TPA: hypothetical protein VMC43_04010 [Candidatus Paceibacterota bacterium]|nr:hypothetical protein [Candidatus Paceibacterota bacterium]
MRRLRFVGMCAVLAAGLVPSVGVAQDVPIMPLSDVKPGMKGYGLTVFRGTEPQRFEFEVRGVAPDFMGWPRVIVVRLFGGPKGKNGKSVFETGQVFGGMSGSPMYIDGKLIGGLALAKDFSTTAKTLITPIEYMLDLGRVDSGGPTAPTNVRPGEYMSLCLVYGDSDFCFDGTVTAVHEGHIYTMAHGVSLENGKTQLPVFRRSVVDLLESQAGASKISGLRGAAIGTASVHGMFGIVVRPGNLPKEVPVTLTINDVYPKPLVVQEKLPYSNISAMSLTYVLGSKLGALPIAGKTTRTKAVIRLRAPAGVIRLEDTAPAAVDSVVNILNRLLDQEGEKLEVEGADFDCRLLPVNELWSPFIIKTDGKGKAGKLLVLARKGADNALGEFVGDIDLSGVEQVKASTLQWLDGTDLQREILARMPVREAMPLLAQIENHEALYLVSMVEDKDMPVEWANKESAPALAPSVRVLASTTLGGHRFLMSDNKPMPFNPEPKK